MKPRGLCLVLSAPSGGGKTTLIREMLRKFENLRHSISYTTRSPRNEADDQNAYHFISDTAFRQMIDEDRMLEWAEVHGKLYGTSADDLEELLSLGYDVAMDIDVQGAIQLRDRLREAVYVFIVPPSMEELERRLRNRRSETEENLRRRLTNARREIKYLDEYDYVVVNDELDEAIDHLRSILIAEHLSTSRQEVLENVRTCLKGNENAAKEA